MHSSNIFASIRVGGRQMTAGIVWHIIERSLSCTFAVVMTMWIDAPYEGRGSLENLGDSVRMACGMAA
ncbi:hypothetical protein AcV7_002354 [Taiwanofungus camphoratus]|nr:hypothetical protein AcV7_002354 [Antrodia cinnamomea]